MEINRCNLTVEIKNAAKSYQLLSGKSQTVFERLNLTLAEGTIYGLLGPSGCGKTSLLRCIIGRLNLDEGSVLVFGHHPGSVESGIPGPNIGYMPQETCIHKTLTIGEIWTYYACILGISSEKINLAVKYFIDLLNLPPKNTINENLSGGQLRRVAFATAVIHEPKLLILDEPTVGIDPITKQRMWKHLLQLANDKGISIILTTHYIEEARAAHKVGLMHGQGLVEDYTDNLLRRFDCTSLEDVFLKICCNASSSEDLENRHEVETDSHDVWIPMNRSSLPTNRTSTDLEPSSPKKCICTKGDANNSSNRSAAVFKDFRVRSFVLKAAILKNLIHFYRFPGAIVFSCFIPCIEVFLSVYSFGVNFDLMPIAVVNEDFGPMGSQYLSFMDADIVKLDAFNSSATAFAALRAGVVRGVVFIQQNFSEAFLERVLSMPMVDPAILYSSTISATLDNTYLSFSTLIRFQLLEAFDSFLRWTFNDLGMNPVFAQPVITLDEGDVEYIFQANNMDVCIGLLTMSCFFAAAAVAVLNLFVERDCGYLERTIVSGVSYAEIILSVMIILLAVLTVQVALVLLISYFTIFPQLSVTSFFMMFCVLYCLGFCGIAFGFVLSMCCSQVYVLLIATGFVAFMTGAMCGSFWPLESMPSFLRYVMLTLPPAYPVRAVDAIYMGSKFYLSEMQHSIGVSLIWTAICLVLTVVLLRRKG